MGSHNIALTIADDNQPNVELLEAYLSDVDCDIEIASDGRETLERVASFAPHLILLDVMMPGLSGFEVCEQLKKDPKTRKIMILMVTALNELGDIERAVEVVRADTFVNDFPDGLNTRLHERGGNLSMGQRQLLSFARVLAHDPDVLILDEAAGNIDTETEKLSQEDIEMTWFCEEEVAHVELVLALLIHQIGQQLIFSSRHAKHPVSGVGALAKPPVEIL